MKVDDKIKITETLKADSRSGNLCTEEELLDESKQHIYDVIQIMNWMALKLTEQSKLHDHDKITPDGISLFHKEFIESINNKKYNFITDSKWFSNHKKVNRHHLDYQDGVPDDVNLFDVFEQIADCAEAARSRNKGGDPGITYPKSFTPELLLKAAKNTYDIIYNKLEVIKPKDKKKIYV
jgi:hypothetical protein